MINLTATNTSGNTGVVIIDDTDNVHVTVEFTPGGAYSSSSDIEKITISDRYLFIPDVEVIFDRECTPENPFYIRWINRHGGFEYQMFDQHKLRTLSAGGFIDFHPAFSNTGAAARTREIIGITEARDTVTVGLEQLDPDDYARLSMLIFSPRIDVYNIDLKRWEGITLDNNAKVAWDTRASKGAVEFVFRMKDIQLQF